MALERESAENDQKDPQGAGRDVLWELEGKDPKALGEELELPPERAESARAGDPTYYEMLTYLGKTPAKDLGEELEASAMDGAANEVANEVRDERMTLRNRRDSMQKAAIALEKLLLEKKVDPKVSAVILADALTDRLEEIRKNPKSGKRREYEYELSVSGALYTLLDDYGIDREMPAHELVGLFRERAEKLAKEYAEKFGEKEDGDG